MPEAGEAAIHVQVGWETLDAAQTLLAEGHLPDAAERAYYAMHRAVRALLVLRGEEPRTHRGAAHLLRDLYVVTGDLDETHLVWFQRGIEVREAVDYGTGPPPDEETVRDLLDHAERLLQEVEARMEAASD